MQALQARHCERYETQKLFTIQQGVFQILFEPE